MVKVENKETLRLLTSRFIKNKSPPKFIAVNSKNMNSQLLTNLILGSV